MECYGDFSLTILSPFAKLIGDSGYPRIRTPSAEVKEASKKHECRDFLLRSNKDRLINGQPRVFDWRPRDMMSAIHGLTAKKIRQTCPKCYHGEIVKTVRPDNERPRKHYCAECGYEWWESLRRSHHKSVNTFEERNLSCSTTGEG